MGTLKLSNIKHKTHLKDCINYIFKDSKTEDGTYIFGDSGFETQDVYDTFKETKKLYGKEEGRQAYHYMLTFAEEDNVTPAEVQEITEKVMKRLFPEGEYDWAAAVHTDTMHLHSHIVFNSVNNRTGLKYRYEKGDWERKIQKIVDDECEKRGFKTIAYEYDFNGIPKLKDKDDKAGTNYEKHNPEIKSKADVIRMDIDRCIIEAKNYDQFIKMMQDDGYNIRQGISKKYGEYITFKPFNVDKGVRSCRLGENYTPKIIKERLKGDKKSLPDKLSGSDFISERTYNRILNINAISATSCRKVYAKNIYIAKRWKNKKPFMQSYVYKAAIIENSKMIEEYKLVKSAHIECREDIEQLLDSIKNEIKGLYKERKRFDAETNEAADIAKKLKECYRNKKIAERIEGRIEKLSDIEKNMKLEKEKRAEIKKQ